MPCTVICISATEGAGGQEVGRRVAESLGYRLVGEGIVARAAQEAGVESHEVADAERRRTFVRRLLDDIGSGGGVAASASLGAFLPFGAEEAAAPAAADLRALIRAAIEETAARGRAVILAHAASFALAGRPETLRVLVTADAATRRRRLAAERGVDETAAGQLVRDSDAGRAAYLKRFYGVGAELPTHYDLVVNTDRLTVDDAADLLVRAASAATA